MPNNLASFLRGLSIGANEEYDAVQDARTKNDAAKAEAVAAYQLEMFKQEQANLRNKEDNARALDVARIGAEKENAALLKQKLLVEGLSETLRGVKGPSITTEGVAPTVQSVAPESGTPEEQLVNEISPDAASVASGDVVTATVPKDKQAGMTGEDFTPQELPTTTEVPSMDAATAGRTSLGSITKAYANILNSLEGEKNVAGIKTNTGLLGGDPKFAIEGMGESAKLGTEAAKIVRDEEKYTTSENNKVVQDFTKHFAKNDAESALAFMPKNISEVQREAIKSAVDVSTRSEIISNLQNVVRTLSTTAGNSLTGDEYAGKLAQLVRDKAAIEVKRASGEDVSKLEAKYDTNLLNMIGQAGGDDTMAASVGKAIEDTVKTKLLNTPDTPSNVQGQKPVKTKLIGSKSYKLMPDGKWYSE